MSENPTPAPPDEPAFGLVDVIETFTAMRHEFRTQSNEDRKLADQLAGATERIERLENRIQESIDRIQQNPTATSGRDGDSDSRDSRRLCETLAEIDHHLSRTVETAIRSLGQGTETDGRHERAAEYFKQQIDLHLNRTGLLRRWLVRSWARQLQRSFTPPSESISASTSSTISALRMLHERVSRLIRDAGVERIDVTGKPFDGSLMNAVDSVSSDDYPGGHVVFQLSPAYRWREAIIRYAEVNVSSS